MKTIHSTLMICNQISVDLWSLTLNLQNLSNVPLQISSPTILQADTWKKGLEVVLQPNSTLVMRASTRSQKEVVPLQNSTLVMLTLKTSTGGEKTHQDLETSDTSCATSHWNITFQLEWTCDQRQLPQDQDQYWKFKEKSL